MKVVIIILFIFSGLNSQAQTKDSVIYKADSINVISVNDLKAALTSLEDKVTKKEYDQFLNAYQFLLQSVDKKRRKGK